MGGPRIVVVNLALHFKNLVCQCRAEALVFQQISRTLSPLEPRVPGDTYL